MKNYLYMLALVISTLAITGCSNRVTYSSSSPQTTENPIGRNPMDYAWPSSTFYYDNWGVFGGGGHHHYQNRYHHHDHH